ncbi:MAG: hypothetical protein WED33_13405 [Bacteroidia bacterium]
MPNSLIGQHYFRMKADFSIKEKFNDGKMALTMGTVYYDRTHKKLVYDVKFPEKEQWVIMDTVFYKIRDKKLIQKQYIPLLPSSTIFESALANNLDNFGLENSFYSLKRVEKDADLVISTWLPEKRLEKVMGKIIISRKNNQLFGIAFYTPEGELVKKQLFNGYLKSQGIAFPAEITDLMYKLAGKETKITSFKNLVVNEMKNDAMYNLVVPAMGQ